MLKKEKIRTTDPEEVFKKGLGDLDEQRVERLNDALLVRRSKTALLGREALRLESKHGKNHPLTLETIRKNEVNEIYIKEIKKEIAYAETPSVSAEQRFWKVYGYVTDSEGDFVPDVTVRFFDKNGRPVHLEGKTDERGFFQIETASISDLPAEIYAGISPGELSEQILTPELGRVDYAEIVLSGEPFVLPCEPPTTVLPSTSNFAGWIVMGKIVDASGKGVGGLTVQVYDKDLVFDDFLDETTTNDEGVYRATFSKEQFSDFGEEYPELYLIIKDEAGRSLFDGKKEARNTSGRIELMDVKLKETFDKKNKGKNEE